MWDDKWGRYGSAGLVLALLPLSLGQPLSRADTDIVPSRTWKCAVGAYPFVSYQTLVTSGTSYTVSWADGTGTSSGTIMPGTAAPLNNGVPIVFRGGAWDGFNGEYAAAGTTTNPNFPPITVDNVYTDGGLDNSYYPTTCSPD